MHLTAIPNGGNKPSSKVHTLCTKLRTMSGSNAAPQPWLLYQLVTIETLSSIPPCSRSHQCMRSVAVAPGPSTPVAAGIGPADGGCSHQLQSTASPLPTVDAIVARLPVLTTVTTGAARRWLGRRRHPPRSVMSRRPGPPPGTPTTPRFRRYRFADVEFFGR